MVGKMEALLEEIYQAGVHQKMHSFWHFVPRLIPIFCLIPWNPFALRLS